MTDEPIATLEAALLQIAQLEGEVDCLHEQIQHLKAFIASLDVDETPCHVCGRKTDAGNVCLACENMVLQVQLEAAEAELGAVRRFDMEGLLN